MFRKRKNEIPVSTMKLTFIFKKKAEKGKVQSSLHSLTNVFLPTKRTAWNQLSAHRSIADMLVFQNIRLYISFKCISQLKVSMAWIYQPGLIRRHLATVWSPYYVWSQSNWLLPTGSFWRDCKFRYEFPFSLSKHLLYKQLEPCKHTHFLTVSLSAG